MKLKQIDWNLELKKRDAVIWQKKSKSSPFKKKSNKNVGAKKCNSRIISWNTVRLEATNWKDSQTSHPLYIKT